ncbi:MFS transporter [Sulfuracidifex tepidarius]|uniref:Major facilitator superfamily (MFS) profile domain-containing protein n=1 Tax=Sulfuracidifex tepidarius TaxID=1294262 RepID=A0A510E639_9CREN|nr:MFS transporter [Sulfuracidifex tepidarius]BBG28003.1 hypothetical protein IC007_2558 [Sulfuracidifex tepidarius]
MKFIAKTWYNKGFIYYMIGRLLELAEAVFYPAIMVFIIFFITRSPIFVSLVYFVEMIVNLVGTTYFSKLPRRFSLKKLLIFPTFLSAINDFSFATIIKAFLNQTLTDVIFILVSTTITSFLFTFTYSARRLYVYNVIGKDFLNKAYSVLSGTNQAVQLISYLIIALALNINNFQILIYIGVALTLLGVLFYFLLPDVKVDYRSKEQEDREGENLFSLKKDFKLLLGYRKLLLLIMMSSIFNFLTTFPSTLEVVYISAFHILSSKYTILESLNFLGSIVGSYVVNFQSSKRLTFNLVLSLFLTSFFILGLSLTRSFTVGLALYGVIGLSSALFSVSYTSFFQMTCPKENLDVFSGIESTLSYIFVPAGMLLSGIITTLVGVFNAFLIISIISFIVSLMAFFITKTRL